MSEIVLIHGCWSHPDIPTPLRSHLEHAGYRVHTPALPGHDLNDPWPESKLGKLSMRDCSVYIQTYIDEQNFDSPPILIGHSMGGLVAQMVASEIPVSALILLNSAAPAGVNHIYPSSIWTTLDMLLQPFFWRRTKRPSHPRAHYGLLNRIPFKTADKISRSLVPESGRVLFELVFWFLDFSKATQIDKEIEAPILILSGGMDRIVLPPVAESMRLRYPLASFIKFPASGHWLFHEYGSERVYTAITDWIKTIPERRSFIEEQKQAHHDPRLSSTSAPSEIPFEIHSRTDGSWNDGSRNDKSRGNLPVDDARPVRRASGKDTK